MARGAFHEERPHSGGKFGFTLIEIVLGGPSACREIFCMFTFKTFFMNPPSGRATYCQSKACYSWSISPKISPYKQMGRIVHTEGDRGGKELVDSLREMRTGGETREGTQNPDALYEELPTGIYVARCRWDGTWDIPQICQP